MPLGPHQLPWTGTGLIRVDSDGYVKIFDPSTGQAVAIFDSVAGVVRVTGSVKDDGVTDVQPQIQAALNALAALGGGRLVAPFLTQGVYAFAASITLKNNVTFEIDPGVTLKWIGAPGGTIFTMSLVNPLVHSGIFCKGSTAIIDPGGATNGADLIFDMHSMQFSEIGGFNILDARATTTVLSAQADCSVNTNTDVKTNMVFNLIRDIEANLCGTLIYKSGLAVSNGGGGAPAPITLNEWRNIAGRAIAVAGCNVVQWADDDLHTGVHTYKLTANNATGIILNSSATPGLNSGVYAQLWEYVAIPFFSTFTGRQGIVLNYSRATQVLAYFEDPAAGAVAVVDNFSQSHKVNRIGTTGTNNVYVNQKNWYEIDETAAAAGPETNYLKMRPGQADALAGDEMMDLAAFFLQTGVPIQEGVLRWVITNPAAGSLSSQLRFLAKHGAGGLSAKIILQSDGRLGSVYNQVSVNAGLHGTAPGASIPAVRGEAAASQTAPIFDTYSSDHTTQLPFSVGPQGQLSGGSQTLVDAATVAIDCSKGDRMILTATAGVGATRALGVPSNPYLGQVISVTFIEDGTGGRALTLNAIYKGVWSNTGNTAGLRSTISFYWDGTNWNQLGAQTPYA